VHSGNNQIYEEKFKLKNCLFALAVFNKYDDQI